jgi:hypothetical protein
MRWEALEQGSEREKDSTVCIRIAQVRTEGPVTNRNVTAKIVEDDILALVNLIHEQCSQHAEDFAPGDIRNQGFEDREGLGRGMVTINRRKVNVCHVCTSHVHHQDERLLLQIASHCDLREPNNCVQGMDHN